MGYVGLHAESLLPFFLFAGLQRFTKVQALFTIKGIHAAGALWTQAVSTRTGAWEVNVKTSV